MSALDTTCFLNNAAVVVAQRVSCVYVIGFGNQANTSYRNAAFQFLFAVSGFIDRFLTNSTSLQTQSAPHLTSLKKLFEAIFALEENKDISINLR